MGCTTAVRIQAFASWLGLGMGNDMNRHNRN